MCDYCESLEFVSMDNAGNGMSAEMAIVHYGIGAHCLGVCVGYAQEYEYTSRCFILPIYYCPMCGRKLGEGNDEQL